jgi:hypothetical protein
MKTSRMPSHRNQLPPCILSHSQFVIPAGRWTRHPVETDVLVRCGAVVLLRSSESIWSRLGSETFWCASLLRPPRSIPNDDAGPYLDTVDHILARLDYVQGLAYPGLEGALESLAFRVGARRRRGSQAPLVLYGGFLFPRILPRYLRWIVEWLPVGAFEPGGIKFCAEEDPLLMVRI